MSPVAAISFRILTKANKACSLFDIFLYGITFLLSECGIITSFLICFACSLFDSKFVIFFSVNAKHITRFYLRETCITVDNIEIHSFHNHVIKSRELQWGKWSTFWHNTTRFLGTHKFITVRGRYNSHGRYIRLVSFWREKSLRRHRFWQFETPASERLRNFLRRIRNFIYVQAPVYYVGR